MFLFISYGWISLITAYAAWSDVQTRTIPNPIVLVGLIGLLAWQILHGEINGLSLIMGTVFALLLWGGKIIGGGDSKLLLLVSTAFAVDLLPWLYVSIALCGAVQALCYLVFKKKGSLPYAVAIFFGTLFLFCVWIFPNSYLHRFVY